MKLRKLSRRALHAAAAAAGVAFLMGEGRPALVVTAAAAAATAAEEQQQQQQQQLQCGLYLAPSSQDPDRWGTWLGVDVKEGDVVSGYPHLAINLHDFKANNNVDSDFSESEFLAMIGEFVTDNVWVPESGGASFEFEGDNKLEEGVTRSSLMITGPGFLARYDARIANIDFDVLDAFKRTSGASGMAAGESNPNRGAISPFDNVVFRSTEDISAGSELYLNYNYNDDDELNEDGTLNEEAAIVDEDYDKIDETITEMLQFFNKHDANLDADARQQIYRFLTEDFMRAAVGEVKAPKIARLFPAAPEDLYKVKEAGGIKRFNQARSRHVRNVEWLQKNGMCMDNIRPGISNIPNAGRGAFATRNILQGGLVAPTPLFHIPDKASLNMYDLIAWEDGTSAREEDEFPFGTQLLMNYVLSHPETSLAFVPTGAHVALINHSDKPNAKLQWSTHSKNKFEKWSKVPPHQFLQKDEHYNVGLMMDVVAIRDIAEGDEVTIDYGEDWKAAWEDHQKSWEEELRLGEIDKEWPVRAADLNEQHKTAFFKTDLEEEKEPYPPHVSLKAFVYVGDDKAEGSEEDPHKWLRPKFRTSYSVSNLYDVAIVQREEVATDNDQESGMEASLPYTYTVAIAREHDGGNGGVTYVTNVPHEAFLFVDDAEMGDQFIVEDTFRHYIGIPDDIFPVGVWRDNIFEDEEAEED